MYLTHQYLYFLKEEYICGINSTKGTTLQRDKTRNNEYCLYEEGKKFNF